MWIPSIKDNLYFDEKCFAKFALSFNLTHPIGNREALHILVVAVYWLSDIFPIRISGYSRFFFFHLPQGVQGKICSKYFENLATTPSPALGCYQLYRKNSLLFTPKIWKEHLVLHPRPVIAFRKSAKLSTQCNRH